VIWRYDPIVLGSHHDHTWHMARFQELARQLAASSSDAVISFLDLYPSARRGLDAVTEATGETFSAPSLAERIDLAGKMALIGAELGVRVRICCEPDVAASRVIDPAACIDAELIRFMLGSTRLELKSAPTRKGCGCVYARDIGAYHCCAHGCVYCYANDSPEAALENAAQIELHANHLGVGDLEESVPARRASQRQLALAFGGNKSERGCR
jgi:hypothetical protein